MAQITTTATGIFYFPALVPGVYGLRVIVDPTGLYATQYYTATNNPARVNDLVVNGNGLTGLVFRLYGPGISGRITAAGALPPVCPQCQQPGLPLQCRREIFTPLQTTKLISATGRYTFSVVLLPARSSRCHSFTRPWLDAPAVMARAKLRHGGCGHSHQRRDPD